MNMKHETCSKKKEYETWANPWLINELYGTLKSSTGMKYEPATKLWKDKESYSRKGSCSGRRFAVQRLNSTVLRTHNRV